MVWSYTKTAFTRRLYKHEVKPSELFSDLKMNAPAPEAARIVAGFKSPSDPYHKFAFGNPLPRAYESIGASTPRYQIATSWRKELEWHAHAFAHFGDELTTFTEKKALFETSFLKDDFDRAERHLLDIENGAVSLWSMNAKFLLLEHRHGLEKNKQFLSELNKRELQVITSFLVDLSSQRAEKKMSAARFQLRVEAYVKAFKQKDFDSFADYFIFRLCFLNSSADLDFANILYWEWHASVYDRYLTSLQISQLLAARQPETKELLFQLWQPIRRHVSDPQLEKLLNFCSPNTAPQNSAPITPLLVGLDLYTKGNYEQALRHAEATANAAPTVTAAHELAAKARAQIGAVRENEVILSETTICKQLYQVLLSIYSRKGNVAESQRQLLKLAYTLRDFPTSLTLFALHREENASSEIGVFQILKELQDPYANPRYAEVLQQPAQAVQFLESLSRAKPESIALAFRARVQSMLEKEAIEPIDLPVPTLRKLEYSAYVCQQLGLHSQAIALLQSALTECAIPGTPENLFALEKLLNALVVSLMRANRPVECLQVVVDAYFRNTWLVSKMPLKTLLGRIDNSESPDILKDIRVPILSHIHQDNPQVTHVAYDNFLSAHNCDRPSNLLVAKNSFNALELHFFLGRVCTLDVMSHSVHFSNTKELEEERKAICRFLVEDDPQNRAVYANEISRITQHILTRAGVQEIEQSKIYVDVNGLKTSSETLLKEGFERYREIAQFADQDQLHLVETNLAQLGLRLKALDEEIPQKSGRAEKRSIESATSSIGKSTPTSGNEVPRLYLITPPSFMLFKELFLELRDRFIASNEYGLDSYLSVRIRHGTLLGQLRRPFEVHHLITQKDQKTEIYVENVHWNLGPTVQDEVQVWLAALSQLVDKTTQAVKDKWIQTRTELEPGEGMFDFSYGELELFKLYKKISPIESFEQFLDAILSELWRRTEDNLQQVRHRISTELLEDFVRMLTRLFDDVRGLPVDTPRAAELSRALLTCRTDIQHVLDNIAKWFTVSAPRVTPESSLRHLLDTTISIINSTYPHVNFSPGVEVPEGVSIQGEFFAAFVDLLLLLIDNILKHSLLTPNEWVVEISFSLSKDALLIKIKNNLSDAVDVGTALKRISALKEKFSSEADLEIVRSEGGTGFAKLYKLLKCDLRRTEYDLLAISSASGAHRFLEVHITMNRDGLV